ncbi:3-keto-5-aminohexanoate cleavage protein [Sphingomonas sp. MMS24-JH45]
MLATRWRRSNETGTRYEFECYDTSMLHNLHYFWREGLVKGLFIQTVFGLLGGIGAHPEEVLHMKRTADRLFGYDYRWSVLGAGKSQQRRLPRWPPRWAAHRVGLEDLLWIDRAGQERQQATGARKIVEGLGLEVATPDEARAILE